MRPLRWPVSGPCPVLSTGEARRLFRARATRQAVAERAGRLRVSPFGQGMILPGALGRPRAEPAPRGPRAAGPSERGSAVAFGAGPPPARSPFRLPFSPSFGLSPIASDAACFRGASGRWCRLPHRLLRGGGRSVCLHPRGAQGRIAGQRRGGMFDRPSRCPVPPAPDPEAGGALPERPRGRACGRLAAEPPPDRYAQAGPAGNGRTARLVSPRSRALAALPGRGKRATRCCVRQGAGISAGSAQPCGRSRRRPRASSMASKP